MADWSTRITTKCEPVVDRAVFILGMHRSGTSALAGALEPCGLCLGPVHRTASPHNALGNYENGAVIALNRAILGPPGSPVPPWVGPAVDATAHDILSAYPPGRIGIKEPNLLYTLAFWARHARSVALIGTIRHPLDVVRSLEARQRAEGRVVDHERALDEWRDFNARILEIRRLVRFPILDFDLARAMYLDRLRDVVTALGLRYDPRADAFVSDSLTHHRSSGDVPTDIVGMYEELKTLAAGSLDADAVAGIELSSLLGDRVRTPRAGSSAQAVAEDWREALVARARLLLLAAASDAEIRRLQVLVEESVAVRDTEIRRLQRVLEDAVTVRDSEIRRLQSLLGTGEGDG